MGGSSSRLDPDSNAAELGILAKQLVQAYLKSDITEPLELCSELELMGNPTCVQHPQVAQTLLALMKEGGTASISDRQSIALALRDWDPASKQSTRAFLAAVRPFLTISPVPKPYLFAQYRASDPDPRYFTPLLVNLILDQTSVGEAKQLIAQELVAYGVIEPGDITIYAPPSSGGQLGEALSDDAVISSSWVGSAGVTVE